MKRRQFIRTAALFSAAALLPRRSLAAVLTTDSPFAPLDGLQLTDFDQEQHEAPILLGNGSRSWLVALRRQIFPAEQEQIACFAWQDGQWREADPVTPTAGQYEALAADCAPGGTPVLAWTELRNGQWLISATTANQSGFTAPVTVSPPNRRVINPVVKAEAAGAAYVAWEQFAGGRFSIGLARFHQGHWEPPVEITHGDASCFEPALELGPTGELYLSYSYTDGPHRNLHLRVLDPATLQTRQEAPIAIGGGLADRVNINARSALAFDRSGTLWISWENNRFTRRLEDADNFTGDRCCAMAAWRDGRLWQETRRGRWLFHGENDHIPTFHKDPAGNLYVFTHCGGRDGGSQFWSFRASALDPTRGWSEPVTLLQTRQKGEMQRPAVLFAADGKSFWLGWKKEAYRNAEEGGLRASKGGPVKARRGALRLERFTAAGLSAAPAAYALEPTVVEEHHPVAGFRPQVGGRPRIARRQFTYRGDTYTLLLGNLHEHSENSNCWPAGADGTLHDDIRYGLYSEGYDFGGITDHGYGLTEIYYRKSLRLAEFYHDPVHYVALPSFEYTLSNEGAYEIGRGVGHRNIFFVDGAEARKFIRDRDEVFCVNAPETLGAEKLWAFIHQKKVDCVSIPHHPADEVHALDWETRDEELEPVVEIFQCRGNAEYRGAPRMLNLSRHHPTANDKGFIDYALREKKYRLGFIASGDHCSMGVGLACVWVKEISRKGILEALRARRCFATTGDKIFVNLRVNGAWMGEAVPLAGAPKLEFDVTAVDDIQSIDILRNSRVVHSYPVAAGAMSTSGTWVDPDYANEAGVLYYYVRVTQKNRHLGWSSPIWLSA